MGGGGAFTRNESRSESKVDQNIITDIKESLQFRFQFGPCPERPFINGNSITHSHSLDLLLFKIPQRTRETSSVIFGIRGRLI